MAINSNHLITVTLYLYGDELFPEHVTHELGMQPTQSWKKGERKPSKRPESAAVASTGFWMLRAQSQSDKLTDYVADIFGAISIYGSQSILKIEGVTDAKLDVYVAIDAADEEVCLDLGREQIGLLASYGLRYCITVDVVASKSNGA